MDNKYKIIEEYTLWDIPNTMIETFKVIVNIKHRGKPIKILVLEKNNEK